MEQPLFRVPEEICVGGVTGMSCARAACCRSDLNHDLAMVCEFDGIADKIYEDLPQASHVAHQDLRNGIVHNISEIQLFFRCLGGEQIQRLLDARMKLEGMVLEF